MNPSSDRSQEILDQLASIRRELHGLRESFDKKGYREEVDRRIDELQVELRLQEIEAEVTESLKPPPKKRRWGLF